MKKLFLGSLFFTTFFLLRSMEEQQNDLRLKVIKAIEQQNIEKIKQLINKKNFSTEEKELFKYTNRQEANNLYRIKIDIQKDIEDIEKYLQKFSLESPNRMIPLKYLKKYEDNLLKVEEKIKNNKSIKKLFKEDIETDYPDFE